MAIYQLGDDSPQIADSAYVADFAVLSGKVSLGENVSVWDHAAIRGDNELIAIGHHSNVQEGAVLHTDPGCPMNIGERVTIGHQAMLHGCTVGDGALIGIQAIVLNRAVIGEQSLVGAGAVVTEGKIFPPRSLILGAPAKVVRELTEEELERLKLNSAVYVYKTELYKTKLKKIG